MVVVVSDGLRSTLTWCKFSLGSMPQTPLEDCALYNFRTQTTVCYAHHTNPHSICMLPTLLQSLDLPLSVDSGIYKDGLGKICDWTKISVKAILAAR